jgi:hypothetical protein
MRNVSNEEKVIMAPTLLADNVVGRQSAKEAERA